MAERELPPIEDDANEIIRLRKVIESRRPRQEKEEAAYRLVAVAIIFENFLEMLGDEIDFSLFDDQDSTS